MKRCNEIKWVMGLICSIALLVSCSQEESLAINQEMQTLSVTVNDAGYQPVDGADTKAVDINYVTKFTPGDKIGLFAVKDGQVVSTVSNLCFTAQDNLVGGVVWKTSEGKGVPFVEGASYYAYYPYQASLSGSLVSSATTATGFFENVINAWTVSTDQSTYAKYTANDLMVGKASQNFGALSFSLTHSMALAVIKTPAYIYAFQNTSPSLPLYYVPLKDSKFNDFKPCYVAENVYYFLTNPTKPALKRSGSYINYSSTKKGWEVTFNGTAGKYKEYNIHSSESVGRSHNLLVGDFLLSDGTFLQYNATLTAEQKTQCVGVVLKVGFDPALDDDSYRRKNEGMPIPASKIHAYVLGIVSDQYVIKQWATPSYSNRVVGASTSQTDFRGYSNTQKIKAYAAANNIALSEFPAVDMVFKETDIHQSAPDFTSGWFLPSMGQCKYWYDNKTRLLESVRKVLWPTYEFNYQYWSSTELDASKAYQIDFSYSPLVNTEVKTDYEKVCPVLVF